MAGRSLRIRSRFALVLVVLVTVLLAVSGVAIRGLLVGQDGANSLYEDHLVAVQAAGDLAIDLEDAHQTALEYLLADTADERQRLITELLTERAPQVQSGLGEVAAITADDPEELPSARSIAASWNHFQQLVATGTLNAATPAAKAAAAEQISTAIEPGTTAAESIVHVERTQAALAHRSAMRTYRSSIELMLIAGAFGLLIAVGVVAWLIRSVLRPTLAYSAFAAEVSRGEFARRLQPAGDDELAALGRVLDDLAQRRQDEDRYEHAHRELIDTLQIADTEREAHDVLKRHLERMVADAEVTLLNRNNSADRLQAVTSVPGDSPLVSGLRSAKPRSCLAVRKVQVHTAASGEKSLHACPVCSGCPALTTCTPLIVGGEVIGSVLVDHQSSLDETEQRSIREAVTQAAPVLGNLRNLAIAEQRAATDSLTGLPNKRAIHDTMRRMIAHASRTMTPLAALMCDIDHFKRINDQYGHDGGDDLLAAVGAAFTATLRAGDFAGRYGGEEFLVALPATDAVGAAVAAEKIRAAIAAIQVPTVSQSITLSVGIAVMPDHAGDSDSLHRAADRALYTAKNTGRDRIVIFTADEDKKTNGTGASSGHPDTSMQPAV